MGRENLTTRLAYVSKDLLDEYWPIAAPMLKLAVDRYSKQFGMEDVKAAIERGDAMLWLILVDEEPMAALTLTETVYPRQKRITLELLGGKNADLWAEGLLDNLKTMAKSAGYDVIETHARSGWSKLAKKYMFKQAYTAYELEIDNGPE